MRDLWVQSVPWVWSECGKIQALEKVGRGDPAPQRQYKFPGEVVSGIHKVTDDLVEQGVLVEKPSRNNSPIWPVRKSDRKT